MVQVYPNSRVLDGEHLCAIIGANMCGRRFVGTHHHNLRVTQPYPQTLKGIEHTCGGSIIKQKHPYISRCKIPNSNPGYKKF